ncbi:SpoIIE family protein phosphatase [Actinoplanes flavus]|uniref:SpoIIE family protein phosphatase n=1 Tax=Actinoplanes flavus TaxID=2820290 RepID=A0ABS3UIR6_9ACTN|nr:SpoIIE family protein phosphatase [Actinoplanes flavus]MBO3738674.1 SpoIIE family protein phosphatase [Actinoplanes flavus]
MVDGPDGVWPAGDPEFVYRLFDEMPLMVIGMEGPRHRIRALTGMYRRYIGRDDVIGVPLLEVFPELTGQRASAVFDRVLATGRSESVRDFRIHYDHPEAGEPVEIFLDFDTTARLGPDGEPAGVVVHVQDVTARVRERQAVQAQAAEAQRRYERARDVVGALQRELLPAGLPVLPGAEVAASYLLADEETAAGGDWFDVVPLPGGPVALVVGDVVGHGVRASAAMGQLRAVLQDRLAESGDVRAAFAAVDRMARRVPGARAATVCVVLLDPGDGTLTWCSAGHPPPLVAGSGGARFLPVSGDGPLGAGASYRVMRDRLEPDEVVLLYSDGIIERPGREPAAATAELSLVVGDVVAGRGFHGDTRSSAVEKACTQTLELLVRQSGHADDITLLAAQRRRGVPRLRLRTTAEAAVRGCRTAVQDWVSALEAGDDDRMSLVHAAVELVTNAYQHARPDAAHTTVTVTADLDESGEARLSVADDGRWRERARPGDDDFRRDHGLGLSMTAGFVDDLTVDRRDDGTTVTVRRRLSRPARLLTADRIGAGMSRPVAEKVADLLLILDQPHAPASRIAVHGPLDSDTAHQLRAELDRHTLGGTHELVVDLTAVTHLASAGVAELHRTNPGTDGELRYPLRLFAPAGSTAQHVLSLVGLPHLTRDPHLG